MEDLSPRNTDTGNLRIVPKLSLSADPQKRAVEEPVL